MSEIPTSEEFLEQVNSWLNIGGEFPSIPYGPLNTMVEAEIVVKALSHGDINWFETNYLGPNLHSIVSRLQSANTSEVNTFFLENACPILHQILQSEIASNNFSKPKGRKEKYRAEKWHEAHLMALKVLSYYGRVEDYPLIIKMARDSRYNNHYMWSIIFSYVSSNSPEPVKIIKALANPLPDKFCNIAYLDFANALAFEKKIPSHPFDTASGVKCLKQHVKRKNGYESYVVSAVKALSFLSEINRKLLLSNTKKHGSPEVQEELKWALSRIGEVDGISFLKARIENPIYHTRASLYANALGLKIANYNYLQEAKFNALVQLSDWLGDEQYFWGQPPSKLEVIHEEKLYWPDADTLIGFWTVKYKGQEYHDEPEEGIGVTSEVGFYRFYDLEDKLEAFSEAVSEDKGYKTMVTKWPNSQWCAGQLKALNPDAFES